MIPDVEKIPDGILQFVFIFTTIVMALLGVYLALAPPKPEDALKWWTRRRPRFILLIFAFAAAINIKAALVQTGKAGKETAAAEGSLNTIKDQLSDTQGKLTGATQQLQKVNDDVNRVRDGVNAGTITAQDGLKQLATNLRQTLLRPPNQEGLQLVSLSAAGLAGEMQAAFDREVKDRDNNEQQQRFKDYREMIQRGSSDGVAAPYLAIPFGPGYIHERTKFQNEVAYRTLINHQAKIKTFLASAKMNVSPNYGTFINGEADADTKCFPKILNDLAFQNYLEPCVAALNHLAEITKPQ